ncbi:MAG: class I SAM-dependent methyltransferase [Betaproteobacteria bacterium]|nr:class I SAM-dependent methyltransferase [Betaproteobacteria bacterium]
MARRLATLLPGLRSVVDVGCGTGCWLNEFRLCGVDRVLGLDLCFPDDDLMHVDSSECLTRDVSSSLELEERFDLALCLEVAQYVAHERADTLISNLTGLSDVVLFSAGIPGQGGIPGSNEQWLGYWAARFRRVGYTCHDLLRAESWYDDRIDWRYRQGMVLFARGEVARALMDRASITGDTAQFMALDVVHPEGFVETLHAARLGASSPGEMLDRLATNAEVHALRSRLEEIERSTSWQIMTSIQQWAKRRPWLLTLARKIGRPLATRLRSPR